MVPEIRLATAADLEAVLSFSRALYEEDGVQPVDEAAARKALRQLLEDPALGEVWVLATPAGVAGYVVLTFGFSLEFRGRNAFLDELYVAPALRDCGWGKALLANAEEVCRQRGIAAMHLEVERANSRAQEMYRRCGFQDHDRYLLTKWLE